MVMVHGDDKGLVLPPKVASTQVIVIPVPYKDADTQGIDDACIATVNMLCEAKIRAELDSRDYYSPKRKYSEWEMKGVPLRIEIGSKDLANEQVINVVLFLHLFLCYFTSTLYVQSTPNKLFQFCIGLCCST
jgi:prolyl-tRNA synthetase